MTDLSNSVHDFNFALMSMHDKDRDLDERYLKAQNFKGLKGKKLSFILSALYGSRNANIVILSHINLLLVAWIIKAFSSNTRIIMFAHGIEVWSDLPHWKKKFLQRKVEIWAVSKYTSRRLSELHQIDLENVKIINNCLDPFFQPPTNFTKSPELIDRYGLTNDQQILFTLTRLSSQESYKGYDRVLLTLPELIKDFPRLRYIIAGKADDLERNRVNELIKHLGVENHVSLIGFVKDDELDSHLLLGDIFIMPSSNEGFGIVFIEAASNGCKVIAGNIDGSVDALMNGDLGSLVDPNDLSQIASAIRNNFISKKKPQEIQDKCLQNFSYGGYFDKIKELILPSKNIVA
ncbi:MAG: glycosyltransferase [Pedobacter sp.]|nr:MAG: glycosyltransferase [Pedobacter sp.]